MMVPRVRYQLAVALVVAAGGLYVVVTAWAMARLSYDIWGVFVALPLVLALMASLIVRLTRHQPHLRTVLLIGLGVKIAGTITRYWMVFGAYGGAGDSQRYHDAGRLVAGNIRSGTSSLLSIIPTGTGTDFIDSVTGTLYTLVGSSKMAGFLWFSALGYIGVILCVKAADLFPQWVDARRYAWLCCVAPSLVFWPSSIGKESWMILSLGLVVYGASRLFAGAGVVAPLLVLAAGGGGAVLVRPHMAAVWLAAVLIGVLWTAFGASTDGRGRGAAALVLIVGVIGLVAVSRFALQFLPSAEEATSLSDQLNTALDETTRRTSGGGSEFRPPTVASPLDYPVAILRTITRPLPQEVTGLSTLIPSVETSAFLVLCAVGFRRLMALPALLRRSSVVVMHLLIVVASALAYTTFSNLAILVRQRSLLIPSLLFLVSVVPRGVHRPPAPPDQLAYPEPQLEPVRWPAT